MAVLGYVDKEQVTLAVTLLVLAVGLNAGVYSGFQVNHIDLSPNFAGTMMGITNGLANILSILGPLAVGFIVTDEVNSPKNKINPIFKPHFLKGSSLQWRTVFWIAAVVYFVGNIVFLVLGDGVIQPWNDPSYSKNKPTNEDVESNAVD